MSSWIKLHRSLLDWEWYQNANTFRLFMHLLMSVNYEKKLWRGIEILPGQLVTSRKKLASELGISEQPARTALFNLQSTQEITIKTTNKYTIVTICKWDKYQSIIEGEQPAKQPTNNQQTNQQITSKLTTTKEYKNIRSKEIKNKEGIGEKFPTPFIPSNKIPKEKKEVKKKVQPDALQYPFTSIKFLQIWNDLNSQPKWKKKGNSARQIALNQLGRYEEEFSIKLMERSIAGNYQGVVFSNTDDDYQKWLRNRNNNEQTESNFAARVAAASAAAQGSNS